MKRNIPKHCGKTNISCKGGWKKTVPKKEFCFYEVGSTAPRLHGSSNVKQK